MTTLVEDPGRIAELAASILRRELSIEALMDRYLSRVDAVDSSVEAWRMIDASAALSLAAERQAELERHGPRGLLHGIPVAVKDVIDIAGFPTRAGSRLWENNPVAATDAEVVSALRAAGAIPIGKVHTTEFAFFDPSPARNPHDLGHTPGGSSSGSAAAVAAGMVPAALGTQTVASVNRPASYCGVAAFKPSTGSLSTFGVTPLAPMYDTVGFFGGTVADAVMLYCAMRRGAIPSGPLHPLNVVRLEDPLLKSASTDVANVMNVASDRIRAAGHTVEVRRSPVSLADVGERQWFTAQWQMARMHSDKREEPLVGERFRDMLEKGARFSEREFARTRWALAEDAARVYAECADADAILWPAAPTTAPLGLGSTGDPRFIGPWTALGGPVVTAPCGFGVNGLPIGVLLIGQPGLDLAFASVASILGAVLA